jgi:hypothetical protein
MLLQPEEIGAVMDAPAEDFDWWCLHQDHLPDELG